MAEALSPSAQAGLPARRVISEQMSLEGSPTLPSSRLGPNAGARTLTRSDTDEEAIRGWLARYQESPNTLDAYHRDAERLLAWSRDRGLSLAQLMVEDLTAYSLFLRDPQPLEKWCLVQVPRYLEDDRENPEWKTVRRPPRLLADGSLNPEWRPFIGALSSSAASQTLTVLYGMFEYLCGVGYLAGNPLRAARTRQRQAHKKTVERYLEQDLWQYILAHIETWPRATCRQEAHYQRSKFLVQFLKQTALRRFEMCQATTRDLKRQEGLWWLQVKGKGGVDLPVPLNSAALTSLQAYRTSTGRPAWPHPDVEEPLLMDICGKGRPVSVKTLHRVLVALFASAASACPDPYQAEKLRAASAHWLRHTAATHMLQSGMSILHTRDVMRHASVQTTEIYIGTDQRQLHTDMEQYGHFNEPAATTTKEATR